MNRMLGWGWVVCGMMLMMGCSSQKEDAAFERCMDGLAMGSVDKPISELDFELRDKSVVEYTTVQRYLCELAQVVCEFDRATLVEIALLGGDKAEVNGAVNSMMDSYEALVDYAGELSVVCRMDVDSAMELYNSHRTKVGIVVATIREELGAIADYDIFLRPYGFVEDTMMYENEMGCTRESYVMMDERLGEVEVALAFMPEVLSGCDVMRLGRATNFEYSMVMDGKEGVYSTFAIYDEELDSIVFVDRNGLPLWML